VNLKLRGLERKQHLTSYSHRRPSSQNKFPVAKRNANTSYGRVFQMCVSLLFDTKNLIILMVNSGGS